MNSHIAVLRACIIGSLFLTAVTTYLWFAGDIPPVVLANSGGSVTYYSLTKCTPTGGAILNSPTGTTFVKNTVVTLTADPNPGYDFSNWTGSVTGSTNPVNVTMNANKNVCATFVVDTTPPVIVRSGSSTVYTECGWGYSDGGATATDNRDGNISSRITVSGLDALNTGTPGTYTITYNVQDDAENYATPVTRTVIVQDTEAPIITLLGTPVVHLECGEEYGDDGATALDSCRGDVTSSIEVGGLDEVGDEGAKTYTITYDVMDLAGNHAIQKTRQVIVDDTGLPVITASAEVNLPYGAPWGAHGSATASDDCDGNLTESIVMGGDTVDTMVSGQYHVTYNVSDASGNHAAQKLQTVVVQSPPVPLVSFDSSATIVPESIGSVAVQLLAVDWMWHAYPISVSYSISGTATPGLDHNATNGRIDMMLAGTAEIEIPIYEDAFDEGDETIVITLFNSSTAIVEPSVHTITIQDNEDTTLTVLGPENGNISLTPPDPAYLVENGSGDYIGVYEHWTTVSLEAIPEPGFLFTGWHGDLEGIEPEILLTANFDDEELDETWTVDAGTWAIGEYEYLAVSSETGVTPQLRRSQSNRDVNIQLDYRRVAGTAPFSTILRRVDADNYLAISFGPDEIQLAETTGGTETVLAVSESSGSGADEWYHVEIELDGSSVRAWRKPLAGPETLLFNGTTSILTTTTFGFKTGPDSSYDVDNLAIHQLARFTKLNLDGSATVGASFLPPDDTAPVLSLVGEQEIVLEVGQSFSDPGAQALDERDGDITQNVMVGGDVVDTQAHGIYTVTYDVMDRSGNAAQQITRTVKVNRINLLTLSMPTAGFSPEVDVAGGMVEERGAASWKIRAIQGDTVTIAIPGNETVDLESGLAFGHWESEGEEFDDSRTLSVQIEMSEDKTVAILGTDQFSEIELIDPYGPSPENRNEYVKLGTTEFSVEPSDAQLARHVSDIEGRSTTYYFYDDATVTFTPLPEDNYAFDKWTITPLGDLDPYSLPLVVETGEDRSIEPVLETDPDTLIVNVSPEGAGKIAITPDPLNGELTAARRVEHFSPLRSDNMVTLRAIEVLENSLRFHHWSGGSIDGLTDREVSFPLADDLEVTAIYVPAFALSVTNLGRGAVTIEPPVRTLDKPFNYEFYPDPAVNPEMAGPVEVTLTPVAGALFRLDHWILDGEPVFSTQPLNVSMDQAHEVIAVHMPSHLPQAGYFGFGLSVLGEGTVQIAHTAPHSGLDRTVSASDGAIAEELTNGTEVTVIPTAASGWDFDHWEVRKAGGVTLVTGALSPISVQTNLVAVFSDDEHAGMKKVSMEQFGEGAVIPGPGAHWFEENEVVNFTAIPEPGWKFKQWIGGPNTTSQSVALPISGDMSVKAYFEPEGDWDGDSDEDYEVTWYTLFMEASEGGTVYPGESVYPGGAPVTITATNAPGWTFSHWEGDVVHGSESPTATFPMESNTYVQAVFEPVIEIIIPAVTGGTVIISPLKPEGYKLGDVVTFTPVPDEGFEFDYWVGDLANRGSDLKSHAASTMPNSGPIATSAKASPGSTVTLDRAPFKTRPVFKRKTYNLNTKVEGSGTVQLIPKKDGYFAGEEVNMVAQPANGWTFSHWDQYLQPSTNPTPEFAMPASDITVTAVFAQSDTYYEISSPYYLKDEPTGLVSEGSSNISSSPGGWAQRAGSRIVLTARSLQGYEFERWTGTIEGDEPEYTIESLQDDVIAIPVYAPTTEPQTRVIYLTLQGLTQTEAENPFALVSVQPTPLRTEIGGGYITGWIPPYYLCIDDDPDSYPNKKATLKFEIDASVEEVTISAPGQICATSRSGYHSGVTILGEGEAKLLFPQGTCQPLISGAYYYSKLICWKDVDILRGRVTPLVYDSMHQTGGHPDLCSFRDQIHQSERESKFRQRINVGPGGYATVGYDLYNNGVLEYQYAIEEGTYQTCIGTGIKIRPLPTEGYEASEVEVDSSKYFSEGYVDYIVSFDEYPQTRTIVLSQTGEGIVTGAGEYPKYEDVTVKAEPAPGWKFAKWKRLSGSVFSIDSELVLDPCNAPNTLIATFEEDCEDKFVLKTNVVGEGVVFNPHPEARYDCNKLIQLHAVAGDGFIFKRWAENGTPVLEGYPFLDVSMSQSREITAEFEELPETSCSLNVQPTSGIVLTSISEEVADSEFVQSLYKYSKLLNVANGVPTVFAQEIMDNDYDVVIEHISGPTVSFFLTDAWIRQTPATEGGGSEQGVFGATTAFNLRDLQSSSLYAVAYGQEVDGVPLQSTVKFSLYRNGKFCSDQVVQFTIEKNFFELTKEGDEEEDGHPFQVTGETKVPPASSDGGNKPPTDTGVTETPEGEAADPVYQFSGEFTEDMVDLSVESPGMGFEWKRVYRSQLVRANSGVQTYVYEVGHGPAPARAKSKANPMGERWDFAYNSWVRRQSDGQKIMVHDGRSGREDAWEWNAAESAWLHEDYPARITMENVVVDAFNANQWINLTYEDNTVYRFYPEHESFGGKKGRLKSITDRNRNAMEFIYETDGNGDSRLSKILDTAGRSYYVDYYATGRIKSVRDFSGRNTYYEYSSGGDLTAVRDSRGAVVNKYEYDNSHRITKILDGRGNTYLTNEYDTTSTNFMQSRVVRQIYGGGDFHFSYEDLCPECTTPGGQDKMRVTVNDGEGNVQVTLFDSRNRTKWERIYADARPITEATRFADLPTDSGACFETSYQYAGETSLVTRKTFPKGDFVQYTYGGAADEPANQRTWWTRGNLRTASYFGVGESSPLVEKWSYTDKFGNYGHNERFVERYEDASSNVTTCTFTSEGDVETRTLANSATESFIYNDHGQVTEHVLPVNKHGHARKDKYTYNDKGYLTDAIVDFDGLALTTTYELTSRGLSTETEDPRHQVTTRAYDYRDRLKWERSPDLDSGRKVVKRFEYDGNNNLVRTMVSNFDEQGDDYANEDIERVLEYDVLNRPTAVLEEVEEGKFIRTETIYDKNGNVLERRSAAASTKVSGTPPAPASNGTILEPDNKVTYAYNTRQLVASETHGDFEGTAYNTQKRTYVYDANGNVTEVHEIPSGPEAPRISYSVYDGFNRLDYATDPMGNVTDYAYDRNGNVLEVKQLGELVDLPTAVGGPEDLDANRLAMHRLSETDYEYDELNRKRREIVHLFDPSAAPAFAASTIEKVSIYDLYGNVSESISPNQEHTLYAYDTANRLLGTEDAKGNTLTLERDENGNIVSSRESNLSDVSPSNAPVIYTTATEYDALNRPTKVMNLAGTITSAYDSQGNVVYTQDGRGNETRVIYDGLGRSVETHRLVPGKPDVITRQRWDVNSRLTGQFDPNNNETENVYDSLDRLDKIRFEDGTEIDYTHDSFGNQLLKRDANGTETTTEFDALNRPVSKAITSGAISIGGTTAEYFAYDSLGNAVRAENSSSVVSRVLDSISGTRSETLKFKSDNFEKTVTYSYDAFGRRSGVEYPGGRSVGYDYDALNRVSTIESSQGGDGSGLLAQYQYLGARRVERRTTWGNGTYLDYSFDNVGRVNGTTHRHIDTNVIFDDRSYTWDGANNKTQRVEKVGGVSVKTFDYVYDALNRMERSTKTLPSATPGTAGSWTGAMTLASATPGVATFAGDDALALAGDFDEAFDPGTLQVFVSKVQGVRDETVDYPAHLQGYTGSQIDVLTPSMPYQGTFDLYASALNGATRVYSNPVSVAYGPLVTEYDLNGAGNRGTVETSAETDVYASEDDAPPADAQMNQYTQTPGESAARAYDENGNLLRTGAALPALFRHDYLDRIVEMSGIPTLDSGSGVPVGNEFSDDFASGLDATWVNDPAFQGGLGSALWSWDSAGTLKNTAGTAASAAFPRTNPDGDFWWVYARPAGATGDDVLSAHLRITGHDTDTQQTADFLMLDIDADEISLWRDGTGGGLASAAISTADDTPYLIHAHLFGSTVVIRRGQLGQPLETVLTIGNAPIQATDRFILSTASACIVDNVNIGHFETQYAYDALGRRIEKRTAEGTTRYVYDGARVAEEWSLPEGGNPTLAASYVYGLYIDEVLTMRRGGSDYYYHGDDMHNVVKLTDSDGEVVEAYDYGDYGQPEFYDATSAPLEATASSHGNPYLFNGHCWDQETGLYWYRTRYMDPELGRFVARDTIGLWGDKKNLGNPYTYLNNNPWSGLDPYGKWWWDAGYIQEGGGALLGVHGAGAAGNAWAGAGVGALQGAAVVLDTPGQLVEWAGIGQRPLRYLGAYNDTDPGIFASRVSAGVGWTAATGAAGLSKSGWDFAITGARAGEWIHAGDSARQALLDDPGPSVYDGPYEPTNWPEEQGTDGSESPGQENDYLSDSENGSYTNTHESGKTYSGKGGKKRSQVSGRKISKEYSDPHTATDWTPAENEREAFKQESRRLEKQGGANSCRNHNKIESPGRIYRIEDGEL